MKRNFVQFALDVDTIGFLKFVALRRHVTMTALLQSIVVDFLSEYVRENVNESQAPSAQEEG